MKVELKPFPHINNVLCNWSQPKENLEARKPRSGPDEDDLGYVVVCLVRGN